ncbi:MAG: hypothetical protein JW772_01455 [Candidatus Diapherotrites archaeon]|nr:hypothetical protein [Candidatus Diapherotrites archaeon]
MNKKGVFCFLIVLCFALAQASVREQAIQDYSETEKALEIAFELEKLDLERTILEQNTDVLIGKTLEKELKSGITEPEKIKRSINSALAEFFLEYEKGGKLKFLGGPVSKDFLNANSIVIVIECPVPK